MVVGLVRTGDPGGASHDAGVDQVADLVGLQRARADVAPHQEGVLGEVLLVQQGHFRRGQRGFQALHVHFAVAGNADPEELPLLFTRGPRLDHDVLEGVGGGERTAQACVVEELHQGLDGGGVRGVVHPRLRQAVDGLLGRRRGDHGFHVGGVVGAGAAHERVFPGGGDRQELFGSGAAHRAGRGLDDHVLQAEPVEDADVGLAVRLIGALQPFVVEVEGVGVLHVELPAPQDPGARPRLVAELLLDLVEDDRVVLVRGVLALDEQGEQFFVVGPSR